MPLLQLPTEIVIVILSYVTSVRDLVACNQVCKAIHALFDSSPRLSYNLVLARAGLADRFHDTANFGLKDRSELVRILEKMWSPESLRLHRQPEVTIGGLCIKYQVSGGVVVSGILTCDRRHLRELQVHRLPSYLTGSKAKQWKHDLTGTDVTHFKADPVQDLLVLIEESDAYASAYTGDGKDNGIMIHLRNLSSNNAHPAACLPLLQFDKSLCDAYSETLSEGSEGSYSRITVRIYSDILGVFITRTLGDSFPSIPGQALSIWQWTSGQLLASFCASDNIIFSDFTFTGRGQVVLTHPRSSAGPGVSMMRLPCSEPYSKSPAPFITPIHSFKPSTTFQLPAPYSCPNQCVVIPSIRIISDPTSESCQNNTVDTDTIPNMFVPSSSPATTIIGFSVPVLLRNAYDHIINHTLLVRASLFSSPRPATPTGEPARLAFKEWSTRDVCWFSGPTGFLYGQRYSCTIPEDDGAKVEIYDFNPCHVARPSSGWKALVKMGRCGLAATLTPRINLFNQRTRTECAHRHYLDHKLKSCMPYKRQTMKASRLYAATVSALDSERIIFIGAERGGYLYGFMAYDILPCSPAASPSFSA